MAPGKQRLVHSAKARRPAMWRCRKCGRAFANRNQSHSCGRHTLAHHLEGKPSAIRALYDAVVASIRRIGPVRMSFAQLTPRRRWIDGHVVLSRRIESSRFTRVETFSPRNHLHAFRLTAASEVDAEFRAWMREAYSVGEQRHLARRIRRAAIGSQTSSARRR